MEQACKSTKSITLKNTSNTYSTFNSVKFDTEDSHDQFLLYSQFVAWYCKGSSITLLSIYANNLVLQELPTQSEYFMSAGKKKERKGYTGELKKLNRDDSNLSITITLKAAVTRKIRLCMTRYFQGEYLYSLSREGLIMNYKEYSVNRQKKCN